MTICMTTRVAAYDHAHPLIVCILERHPGAGIARLAKWMGDERTRRSLNSYCWKFYYTGLIPKEERGSLHVACPHAALSCAHTHCSVIPNQLVCLGPRHRGHLMPRLVRSR